MDREKAIAAVRRMMACRTDLLRDYPFFGGLLMRLDLSCASCGTACTDGTRLMMDPEFAARLGEEELRFVMLHEVLHCALQHLIRGRGLEHETYNIACDIVVNSILLQARGLTGLLVDGEEVMHTAPDGKEGREYNAEQVYEMLRKDKKARSQGGRLDRHDLWQGIENSDALAGRWDSYVLEAARTWGDTTGMPPEVRRLLEDVLVPKRVDWRQVLHDFLQQDAMDWSFCPPDRRFSEGDLFLPAYCPAEGSAGDIWVCVDASGSISDEALTQAVLELEDAMRQTGLSGMVSYFDSEVTEPVPFSTLEEFRAVPPAGGGGTSFHAIFRLMRERMAAQLPKAVLILTDGFALFPPEEAAMGVPVLWAVWEKGAKDIPWGRVIRLP